MNANYSEALEKQLLWRRQYSEAEKRGGLISNIAIAGGVPKHYAGEWVRQVTLPLVHGEPYFWSSGMCDLLEKAGGVLDDWRCDPSILPTPSGFMYFASPMSAGLPKPVRAIGWEIVYGHQGGQFVPITGDVRVDWADAILITTYSESHGAVLPASTQMLPSGAAISDAPLADAVPVTGNIDTISRKARIFAAALLLMNQRVVRVDAVPPERHARRRLERDGIQHMPDIKVVALRRIEVVTRAGQCTDVAWQVRWLVRGHWRQQFYPSKHANRPIWITPYVKGPEDKPLKPPRATVFAVVR